MIPFCFGLNFPKTKINPKHGVNRKRNFKNNAVTIVPASATISLPILESKHELGNFLAAD